VSGYLPVRGSWKPSSSSSGGCAATTRPPQRPWLQATAPSNSAMGCWLLTHAHLLTLWHCAGGGGEQARAPPPCSRATAATTHGGNWTKRCLLFIWQFIWPAPGHLRSCSARLPDTHPHSYPDPHPNPYQVNRYPTERDFCAIGRYCVGRGCIMRCRAARGVRCFG